MVKSELSVIIRKMMPTVPRSGIVHSRSMADTSAGVTVAAIVIVQTSSRDLEDVSDPTRGGYCEQQGASRNCTQEEANWWPIPASSRPKDHLPPAVP